MTPPLHLIEQACPQAHPTTLALIAARREPTWLLGSTPLKRAATAAGLTPERFVSVPTGSARWGYFALRQALKHVHPSRELHAWSIGTLAALLRLGRTSTLVLHLTTPPSADDLRRLRRMDRSTLRFRVGGDTLRAFLIAQGFTAERLELEPPLTLDQAREQLRGERPALRRGWGVTESTPVVALLSDPPTAAHAGPAMMCINLIASSAGRGMRLLVHPEQTGRDRIQTLLDGYGEAERFIQDAGLAAPWSVLRGCDAVLLGAAAAPLSVRYAAAAGLPIVAPDTPAHRDALIDADPAQVHFALNAEPKRLGDRLQHRALDLPTAPIDFGVPA